MLQQADKMGCREFVTAQVFFYQNKINRHYLVKISNIYVNVNVTLTIMLFIRMILSIMILMVLTMIIIILIMMKMMKMTMTMAKNNHDTGDFQDVKNGHQRLNLAFVANLFNK